MVSGAGPAHAPPGGPPAWPWPRPSRGCTRVHVWALHASYLLQRAAACMRPRRCAFLLNCRALSAVPWKGLHFNGTVGDRKREHRRVMILITHKGIASRCSIEDRPGTPLRGPSGGSLCTGIGAYPPLLLPLFAPRGNKRGQMATESGLVKAHSSDLFRFIHQSTDERLCCTCFGRTVTGLLRVVSQMPTFPVT